MKEGIFYFWLLAFPLAGKFTYPTVEITSFTSDSTSLGLEGTLESTETSGLTKLTT